MSDWFCKIKTRPKRTGQVKVELVWQGFRKILFIIFFLQLLLSNFVEIPPPLPSPKHVNRDGMANFCLLCS